MQRSAHALRRNRKYAEKNFDAEIGKHRDNKQKIREKRNNGCGLHGEKTLKKKTLKNNCLICEKNLDDMFRRQDSTSRKAKKG